MAAEISQSLAATFEAKLKPQLSQGASIVHRSDTKFADVTARWDRQTNPHIAVAVEIAEENDVAVTIRVANELGLPFFALAGGHGAHAGLNTIKNGVQINMRKLNSVKIASDGQTATIGGGVLSREVVDALWAENKTTVTGACDATGMVAPMLGGGHGWLQGQKGLIADQLVSANLVLADGSQVTASESQNPDLFWALRGAGHNFGIVTSFTNKIYDVVHKTWAYEVLIFTQDKLESVFEALNSLSNNDKRAADAIAFAFFMLLPPVDPANPVIFTFVFYPGSAEVEKALADPLHALEPVNVTSGETPYPEMSAIAGLGASDAASQHGKAWSRAPIYLDRYDTSAVREAYQAFSKLIADHPTTNASIFLFEHYSSQAVKAVPEDATAFPYRMNNLLVSPAISYEHDSATKDVVEKFCEDVRQILFKASGMDKLHAYVNYARGNETLASLFGYSPWRLEKLRDLKRQFDPHNKFGFYASIDI